MTRRRWLWGAALVALAVALPLRLSLLSLRPLHHDEAINAVKFQELLETGRYVYDPSEYHGPLLYYLTLLPARLSGAVSFADVNERTLRIVPALLDSLLVLIVLFLLAELSPVAAAAAMLLLAVSPAFTYYSRDYIHETYLVFFSALAMLAGWRYYLTRHAWWFFLCGVSLAAMQTTKETYVISMALLGLATLTTMAWDRYRPVPRPREALGKGLPEWVLLGTIGVALLFSILLYSSFFRNPRGIGDSMAALLFYFQRTGAASLHDQPWHYYLSLLAYTKNPGAPIWTEGLILILALVGMGVAAGARSTAGLGREQAPGRRDEQLPLIRFLAVYSLASFLVYSSLRYKTPWLLLNFHLGFILLAGVGAAWLLARPRRWAARVGVAALLLCGAAHLAWQSVQLNFHYYANRRHPYVYAQTVKDFLGMVEFIREAAEQSPQGRETLVAVVAPEYWPLPFYLRDFPHVGYWSNPPKPPLEAPIIITSIHFAKELESRLGEGYHGEYFGLRPDVPLIVYVRRELWDALVEARS